MGEVGEQGINIQNWRVSIFGGLQAVGKDSCFLIPGTRVLRAGR